MSSIIAFFKPFFTWNLVGTVGFWSVKSDTGELAVTGEFSW